MQLLRKQLPSIGYEPRKQADIIPQKRKIIEHRIMKYGPCDCEESILKEEPEIKEAKMPKNNSGQHACRRRFILYNDRQIC